MTIIRSQLKDNIPREKIVRKHPDNIITDLKRKITEINQNTPDIPQTTSIPTPPAVVSPRLEKVKLQKNQLEKQVSAKFSSLSGKQSLDK